MNYYFGISLIVLWCCCTSEILAFKVNITKFGNCRDLLEADEILPVEILTVNYENVNGYVDTIHATYIVRSVDTRDKELVMTIYHCDLDSSGPCNRNAKRYIVELKCGRFKTDDSGPWFMISEAMTGSHCGEIAGKFNLDNMQMKREYLENYLNGDKLSGKYRMKLLFHKKGESVDDLHVRGCVETEFNVFV